MFLFPAAEVRAESLRLTEAKEDKECRKKEHEIFKDVQSLLSYVTLSLATAKEFYYKQDTRYSWLLSTVPHLDTRYSNKLSTVPYLDTLLQLNTLNTLKSVLSLLSCLQENLLLVVDISLFFIYSGVISIFWCIWNPSMKSSINRRKPNGLISHLPYI